MIESLMPDGREASQLIDALRQLAAANSVSCETAEVRKTYAGADQVGNCLIFNRGNTYRLIVRVTYASAYTRGTLLVKEFLTHAEYDEDKWKKHCQ